MHNVMRNRPPDSPLQRLKHRGQTSIMLVLCVVIVLFAILLFTVPSRVEMTTASGDPVEHVITSCLTQSGADAMYAVAAAGGITPSAASLVPARVPSSSSIEDAISTTTARLLNRCYNQFKDITATGLAVTTEDPHVTTTITARQVILTLHQPTTVTDGETRRITSDYTAILETPLALVIDAARMIQQPHPDGIDITPLITANINTTILAHENTGFAIISFAIPGKAEPGRWWVTIPQ